MLHQAAPARPPPQQAAYDEQQTRQVHFPNSCLVAVLHQASQCVGRLDKWRQLGGGRRRWLNRRPVGVLGLQAGSVNATV